MNAKLIGCLVVLGSLAVVGGARAEGVRNGDLPCVLILGDSISEGYTPLVSRKLVGVATVNRPPMNCGPSQFYLRHMESWVVPPVA